MSPRYYRMTPFHSFLKQKLNFSFFFFLSQSSSLTRRTTSISEERSARP